MNATRLKTGNGTVKPGGEELQKWVQDNLGTGRWVKGAYPTVAPSCADEVSRLLKGYTGPVMVVGSGSSFDAEFDPGPGTLILLTGSLRGRLDISTADQTLTVSAGWPVAEVNGRLDEAGFVVPGLIRFDTGTIGGRLATVSSRPAADVADGWIQSLLGLEVVLPTGESVRLGGSCIKDVAGYDLRHMFAGSRGTAGVIVELIFRCLPVSAYRRTGHAVGYSPAGRRDQRWLRLFDPTERMRTGA